jgi:CRP/FNR family transcriptional regulator, cyclic AMP receptor protein
MTHPTDRGVATSLRQCVLFEEVPEPTLGAVAESARRRRFRGGEVIFHRGDPGESVHVIAIGRVKIALTSADGEEAILAILQVGDFFGELSLFDAGERSATAQAMEPTETLELSRSALAIVLNDPVLRERVLQHVAAEVLRLDRQVERLRFVDLTGRVAIHLADLGREQGTARADGWTVVTLPYRQADLAALVGGSRQGVNRALKELESEGLLRFDGREFAIRDLELLSRRAER